MLELNRIYWTRQSLRMAMAVLKSGSSPGPSSRFWQTLGSLPLVSEPLP